MTEGGAGRVRDHAGADEADSDDDSSAPVVTAQASRARRLRRPGRRAVAGAMGAAAAVIVGVVIAAATTDLPFAGGDSSGAASCASMVVLDGVVYYGDGGLAREPELTARTLPATEPGCNDTGDSNAPDRVVTVQEIVGIPTETAVWHAGGLMVRNGAVLPAQADAWRTPPTCRKRAPAVLIGRWLGVEQEREIRFDGDVRPPLHIDLKVEKTVPAVDEFMRWTLRIDDDGGASPGLDQQMVEQALWSAQAALRVTVRCDGKRFVADAFELVPR